ncbi:MAG TPA: hypothetical protein HPP97_01065 [Desulfuromonadales bacterium]|nr:hypothetical protein [Desulfuromonadales bacterium]
MKRKPGMVYSLSILIVALLLSAAPRRGVCADPPWRIEFDETCANTASAMDFSQAQLQTLITRCEKLQKAVEQLDESTRKVFLKRVLMCKNLYQFVLDTKKRAVEGAAQ